MYDAIDPIPAGVKKIGSQKVIDLSGDVRALRMEFEGAVNSFLLRHTNPATGEPCARIVFLAGRPHEHDTGPRWTAVDTSRARLTIAEIIPCSTCGVTGYIRDGRWVDAADHQGDHVFVADLVFHPSWDGDIPDGCLPLDEAHEQARGAAREAWESVDWAAREQLRRNHELERDLAIDRDRARNDDRLRRLGDSEWRPGMAADLADG